MFILFRVLSELAGKDGAPELAKRTKETMFLEQKSDQYSRTIESLQVQCGICGCCDFATFSGRTENEWI